MTYDERAQSYKIGADYPEDTRVALDSFADFVESFQYNYSSNKPCVNTQLKIYRDLVKNYLTDFVYSSEF